VIAQIAGVVIVFPAVAWFQDERAIVVILLTEVVVQVILSNILVRREPVARVDPAIRKAVLKWGIPLMINGAGLIAVKQLDQVIVANLFDLTTLALYALSLNLAITPTSPLMAIGQKIALPFLGNVRTNPHLARQAALLVLLISGLVIVPYALVVGLALDRIVPLLYGQQYQITEGFCALAMFDVFLRFWRGGPNVILLHYGRIGVVALVEAPRKRDDRPRGRGHRVARLIAVSAASTSVGCNGDGTHGFAGGDAWPYRGSDLGGRRSYHRRATARLRRGLSGHRHRCRRCLSASGQGFCRAFRPVHSDGRSKRDPGARRGHGCHDRHPKRAAERGVIARRLVRFRHHCKRCGGAETGSNLG
jgi:hypothetical protein